MIFMVLSSSQSHCESSPSLFDERRLSAGWPPTPRPSPSTWTVSPPEMAATIGIHHRHLLLLSPKADTHFTVPQRVEGWIDLVGSGYIPKLRYRLWESSPDTVTHPSTNRAQRRLTSLITTNTLPLRQTAMNYTQAAC